MHFPERLAEVPVGRRELMVLGVGAFVAAVLPLSRRHRRVLVRRTVPVMGTIAEIVVVHRDPHHAQAAIDAALERLVWVDRTMSRFRASSDVGRANLAAAHRPVRVTGATATVLEEARRWAEASGGAFDPCLGKTVALWNVGDRHEPPPLDRVRRLASRNLYRALEIGSWRGEAVIRFHDRDAAIDLGGIAKGYGVDRAVEALRSHGIRQGLVNVGGDLFGIGESDDGDPWKVGVRSPEDPRRLAGMLKVSEQAVATSGDYIQFFEHRGRRYHHLIDPATGEPRLSKMHSITVMADSCMAADAAATAAFVMPASRADRVLRAAAPDARVVHRA